jgi:hypothetical protein
MLEFCHVVLAAWKRLASMNGDKVYNMYVSWNSKRLSNVLCCSQPKNRLCVSHPLFLLAENMLYMLEIHNLTWPAMSSPTMPESINTRSHVSCIQVTCYFNTLWRFSRLLYLFQTHPFTRNRKLQTHPWHEEPRRFCYATSWSRRERIEHWRKTTLL